MVKIKKGDFIKIKYVGRVTDTGQIFDLNDADVAKKENIYNEKARYEPFTICVGQKDVVKGLDDAMVGKEVGKKFSVELKPEDAFGKRDLKFMQLVSASKFKDQKMVPYPGMPITVNNTPGTVKTVSGGRIMVDFNHPLAGREVKYDVDILKMVEDDAEKVKAVAEMHLGMRDPKVTVEAGVAKIDHAFPEQLQAPVEKSIIERVPSLRKVEFKKAEKKAEVKK